MPDEQVPQTQQRFYPLRDAPFMLRWTTTMTQLFVPYLFYGMVASLFSYQYKISVALVFAFIGMWVVSVVTVRAFQHGQSVTSATLMGVVVGCIILIGWLAVQPIQPPMACYLGLIVYVIYRIRALATTDSAADFNRRTFRFDTIVLIVGLLLFALFSSSAATSPGLTLLNASLALSLLLYVCGRIYTLWGFERLETGTKGASRAGVFIVIAMAIIFALWGPTVIVRIVQTLFRVIGDALGLLLLWLSRLFVGHFTPPHQIPKPTTTTPINLKPFKLPPRTQSIAQHQFHHLWLVICVLLAITAVASLFLAKRKLRPITDKAPDAAEITGVTRTWVGSSRALRFLATNHPIRLQYQNWLRAQHQKGIEINRSQTARQVLSQSVDDAAARLRESIPQYEEARYKL